MAKKEARLQAAEEAQVALHKSRAREAWLTRLPMERASIQAVFYFQSRRRRDLCNLNSSIKCHIDGMREAGLFHDDQFVVLMPPRLMDSSSNPRLELRVTEWDARIEAVLDSIGQIFGRPS